MRRLLFLFSLLCCFGSAMASQNALIESDQPKLVLSIEPDGTISGSYTENEHAIYIEALHGEKNAEEDPSILPYALDIRILDEDKITFLVQNSGVSQGLGDMEWASVLENPDEAVRQQAMEMLPNAIRHVRSALMGDTLENTDIQNLTDENRWEIVAILDLMRSMTEDIPKKTFREKSSARATAMATSYKYEYEVRVMKKPFITAYTSEHSALLVKYYNSKGESIGSLRSCNHGTCADSSSMSKYCSKRFLSNSLLNLYDKICDQFTVYGVHTCNSDTRVQYLAYKYGYWGYNGYSDCFSPRLKAPSCD